VSGTPLLGTIAPSGQEAQQWGNLKDDTEAACAAAAVMSRTVEVARFVEDQAAGRSTTRIHSGLAKEEVQHALYPAFVRLRRQLENRAGIRRIEGTNAILHVTC
jgi:hypothetical protein